MMKIRKQKLVTLIIGVVIGTLLVAGGGLYLFASANDLTLVSKSDYEKAMELGEKYAKLEMLQQTIEEQFLWDVDEEDQMDAVYKAAVDALGDKYSSYMTKEEYEEWENYVTGTFTGIGIAFTEDDKGNFVINRVMEGGPAEAAGLKAGDVLLKVDGKTYDDSNQMAMHMRGEAGTSVKVTYKRDGKTKTVEMIRAEVTELSVYSTVLKEGKNQYGYIQITSFEAETAKQFETELSDLEQKDIQGLIVDLRNNPGGMVDQCVDVADMLLPEAMITYTEDKNGEKETYNSDEHCTKLKYVVLINENSASASEIVAAAVKDNEGGTLVGETTFGKGIIQGTMRFDDESAMTLTIMQYFSPDGKKIHKKGVEPDYTVKLPTHAKTDLQLEKAIDLLK